MRLERRAPQLYASPMTPPEWESSFVMSFVKPALRERWSYMLASAKGRSKHLRRLHHHFDFQPKAVHRLKVKAGEELSVVAVLRQKGAGETAYAVSIIKAIDGRVVSFGEALASFGGSWPISTVLVCVPTRLALFMDEYDVYVLEN